LWPSSAILSRSGIKALGVEWLGERRFSRYRFAHNLMQHYLLHNLDDVEASFLHEDVGRALEDLHGPASDTVALQLARHFDLAGLSAKAQHYLGLAGDRAMEVYANQEALAHYSRALDWATEDVDRFRLLVSRLKVHELSGNQEARRQDLEELEESAARLADPAKLAEVGLQRCKYETAVGNYAAARKAGDDAAALFKGVGDVAGEASARLALGLALYQSANYAEAREECQQALAQAREIARFDIEGGALANLGIVADLTGDRQASRSYFEQALAGTGERTFHPTRRSCSRISELLTGEPTISTGPWSTFRNRWRKPVTSELGLLRALPSRISQWCGSRKVIWTRPAGTSSKG